MIGSTEMIGHDEASAGIGTARMSDHVPEIDDPANVKTHRGKTYPNSTTSFCNRISINFRRSRDLTSRNDRNSRNRSRSHDRRQSREKVSMREGFETISINQNNIFIFYFRS